MAVLKFTLELEKSKGALWFVSSPELKGLYFAKRSIAEVLANVEPVGRELLQAMQCSTPETPSAKAQLKAYESIFGLPPDPQPIDKPGEREPTDRRGA